MLKMLDNAAIDLLSLTSMGVRITPFNRQPVHVANLYEMHATSAETNVLNISASLGLKTKILTRFVRDNAIAEFIKAELRRRNIAYEGPDVDKGGPWGYRHQFNIADSGFGRRGPRVFNDRAGEVGRSITAEDFDLERIFASEGCRVLHLSGLIAALSDETGQCCLEVARVAKQHGTVISFDLNYRASFWEGRTDALSALFQELAGLSDILIGNEEDFQLALGIEGPETGGSEIDQKIESFKGMISRAGETYPKVSVFTTTLREVENANLHNWGALMLVDDAWYLEALRPIPVMDRIGGGDGFVGGMLYAILRGWPPSQWIKFGWATGAMATTMLTDYATPMDEEEVWRVYEGDARVKR